MADNLRLPQSNTIIVDSNGAPLSGAKIEIFDAGTTNQKNVFTDADLTAAANPIVADGTGNVPVRYIGTGAYKVTYRDSADVTLSNYDTEDNVPGALDTSGFLAGSVQPTRPVISISTTTTLTDTEDGKQINADATGGSFTVTLRSAVSMGDGNDVVIKHSGTANNVTVSATQLIDTKNSYILNSLDSATFRSDGGNFHIAEAYNHTDGIVTITYASAITPDLSFPTDTDYQVTLTGALTINAPTNVRVGQRGTFTLIQDATGSHVTTFNAVFNQTGGFTLDTAADAINKINFHVRTSGEIDLWIGNQAQVATRVQVAQNTGLSGIASNFSAISDEYEFLEAEIEGVSGDGAMNLLVQFSEDNGSTFLNAYGSAHGGNSSGTDQFIGSATATTGVSLLAANNNAAGELSGVIFVRSYNNTLAGKSFDGSISSTGTGSSNSSKGSTTDSTAAIDYIRFSPSAGNFDGGTITLYGWRNG